MSSPCAATTAGARCCCCCCCACAAAAASGLLPAGHPALAWMLKVGLGPLGCCAGCGAVDARLSGVAAGAGRGGSGGSSAAPRSSKAGPPPAASGLPPRCSAAVPGRLSRPVREPELVRTALKRPWLVRLLLPGVAVPAAGRGCRAAAPPPDAGCPNAAACGVAGRPLPSTPKPRAGRSSAFEAGQAAAALVTRQRAAVPRRPSPERHHQVSARCSLATAKAVMCS
jgi:hypothetical protein